MVIAIIAILAALLPPALGRPLEIIVVNGRDLAILPAHDFEPVRFKTPAPVLELVVTPDRRLLLRAADALAVLRP